MCAGEDVLERLEPVAVLEVEETVNILLLPSSSKGRKRKKKKAKPEVKDRGSAPGAQRAVRGRAYPRASEVSEGLRQGVCGSFARAPEALL